MVAPTKGKLGDIEVLLTKAFTDQTSNIRWLPFLQGKIGKYWKAAYVEFLLKHHHGTKTPPNVAKS